MEKNKIKNLTKPHEKKRWKNKKNSKVVTRGEPWVPSRCKSIFSHDVKKIFLYFAM
jgi:hypothetical protein